MLELFYASNNILVKKVSFNYFWPPAKILNLTS